MKRVRALTESVAAAGHPPESRSRHASAGLTLVELMVAVAIGSILMLGVITVFISSRDNYRFNTEMSQVQDTARFAVDVLLSDLRMAGYFGCLGTPDDPVTFVNNSDDDGSAPAATALNSTANVIEGIDNKASASTWSPSAATLTNQQKNNVLIMPGTDAITIRRMAGPGPGNIAVNANKDTLTFTSADFADVADSFDDFGASAITNCSSVDVFRNNGAVDKTKKELKTKTDLAQSYEHTEGEAVTMASPFIARRYFVGIGTKRAVASPGTPSAANAADWIPILYRTEYRNGAETAPEEMFQGIEDLQILYGIDNGTTAADPDGIADVYLPAGHAQLNAADEWALVVSIRVAVLVRSLEPVVADSSTLTAQTYQLLDKAVTPNDRFRRRVFTSTITLRNR